MSTHIQLFILNDIGGEDRLWGWGSISFAHAQKSEEDLLETTMYLHFLHRKKGMNKVTELSLVFEGLLQYKDNKILPCCFCQSGDFFPHLCEDDNTFLMSSGWWFRITPDRPHCAWWLLSLVVPSLFFLILKKGGRTF
jgi:hypothetical protein